MYCVAFWRKLRSQTNVGVRHGITLYRIVLGMWFVFGITINGNVKILWMYGIVVLDTRCTGSILDEQLKLCAHNIWLLTVPYKRTTYIWFVQSVWLTHPHPMFVELLVTKQHFVFTSWFCKCETAVRTFQAQRSRYSIVKAQRLTCCFSKFMCWILDCRAQLME